MRVCAVTLAEISKNQAVALAGSAEKRAAKAATVIPNRITVPLINLRRLVLALLGV